MAPLEPPAAPLNVEEPATTEPAVPARPRTRRAVLAGILGGIGAWVAGSTTRPETAQAAAGSPLIIGSSTNNAGTSNTILTTSSTVVAFQLLQNGQGTALMGYATPGSGGTRGVYGRTDSPNGDGVQARNAGGFGTGAAIRAFGGNNTGVRADSDTFIGVWGQSQDHRGVFGTSTNSTGVYAYSLHANGVLADSDGGAKENAAIRANGTNSTNGMAAYLTNNSSFATAHLYNASTGQVLWLQNGGDGAGTGGGDFIVCVNEASNDTQFRVTTNGSALSDGTFTGGGADFAELLPTAGPSEAGDVLAILPNGRVARSSSARQRSVVGVVSTKPGFMGGGSVDGKVDDDQAPVAVLGVVPVKATAENGPIRAGDLLVSASLPGRAMRADEGPQVGTVIGKALGGLDRGTGVVQMMVMLQ